MGNTHRNSRISYFLLIIGLFFSLVGYRLFIVGYVKHPYYSRTAQANTEQSANVLSRGSIYFSDKDYGRSIAATNKKFSVAHIVPSQIESSQRGIVIDFLSEVTSLDVDVISRAANAQSDYARLLPTRLTPEQVTAIKDRNLKGVGISNITDRFYPNGALGADILGFLGYDGTSRSGQYGVESYFNEELFGRAPGNAEFLTAGLPGLLGRLMPGGQTAEAKRDITLDRPQDVVLTIDKTIQTYVEETLDKLLERWSAQGGSIIVQEPTTGRILAMADRPSFNPNTYSISAPETFLNSSVQQVFEPGSSFKPFTMAVGLDTGKISPTTSYEDKGFVEIAEYKIKNFSESVFGRQTMTQVLEKSINTGTMYIENLVGDDAFLNYILNMGFGQKTYIDLPGEVNGDITNLYTGRKINYLTASFGQGIAVTPLQLVNAYSMIANGGKLMRPYVVERVIGEGSKEVVTKPEIMGIPISEKTSEKLRTMLVGVVNNGFDNASIKGYDIAGKTGTAQIPGSGGGYLEDQFIHNFLGFAPASSPRFTILIKIDKPQGITFAADSLSPAFRDVTLFLLNYYNIPPTR
ncbi:MAG: penicillin-binding protein 2 [Candidatus Yanofskybacteria bacterium]|nr:penicillin-binding protein 2 [Candidatus Yanofskybacteria bacterium]